MKHLFLIDPLEKLVIKKDSSLMMAQTFKEKGEEVYLLFEKDFYLTNGEFETFEVWQFDSNFKQDSFYLEKFDLIKARQYKLDNKTIIHFRLDPPFDTRYLRIAWMLDGLVQKGLRVTNNPKGVITHNEKLHSYLQPNALPSYVGASFLGLQEFITKNNITELILKPLDLYQGIGVEKVSVTDPQLETKFQNKVKEYKGAIVAQAFAPEVTKGEVRSLYFNGHELGSILKVPKKGEYLANIAQGASYSLYTLPDNVKKQCDQITKDLLKDGLDFVAFDILGGHVNEVNLTCPGLLVEVSIAVKKNLASEILSNIRRL